MAATKLCPNAPSWTSPEEINSEPEGNFRIAEDAVPFRRGRRLCGLLCPQNCPATEPCNDVRHLRLAWSRPSGRDLDQASRRWSRRRNVNCLDPHQDRRGPPGKDNTCFTQDILQKGHQHFRSQRSPLCAASSPITSTRCTMRQIFSPGAAAGGSSTRSSMVCAMDLLSSAGLGRRCGIYSGS